MISIFKKKIIKVYTSKWIIQKFLFLLVLSISSSVLASLVSDLNKLEDVSDDLGARVLIRRNYNKTLGLQDWAAVRALLVRRPNIGFDVVRAWDMQKTVRASVLEKEANRVDLKLAAADDLMLAGQYNEAFNSYQDVAKFVKKSNGGRIARSLTQHYLNILHQMARALYAAGRYKESIEVYSWIPAVYSQIRQVMFEKMWAGFRAGRLDIALGAIASQQSSYFSRYLDPESYLLKVYILKKLCREAELRSTVKSVRQYAQDLRSGNFTFMDWARADLARLSLAKLLDSDETNTKVLYEIVSKEDREKEKKKIKDYLQMKFSYQKPIIEGQLDKVLGYAALALSQKELVTGKVKELPESEVLEAEGFELWPAKTSEEWLDEIGSHVFVGDSNCK